MVALDVVRDGYRQASGKLFTIPAIGKYVVFVSTKEQVEEASSAPIDQLSFNEAIDEQFRPHIIFNGFRFDPKDPRYSVPINAMKVRMRDNLPALIPRLVAYTNKSFQDELPKKGQHSEWIEISPHGFCQKVVEQMNCVLLLGEDTANDPALVKTVMRYTRDVVMTGEILRFTPSALQE
ncbi:MAG: hypothetical protein Q9193_000718 [Seirophora villosa]